MNTWATGMLLCLGVNHHTAAVEVRERLACGVAEWRASAPSVPHLLLQTCNRTEIYAWDSCRPAADAVLSHALAGVAGVELPTLAPHLVVRRGPAALVHLVRVATGLDSLLVGEEQILGQVRAGLRRACETGTASAPLEGVVGRALEAGRRIRAETMLGRRPSLASAAVAVALRTPQLAEAGLAGSRGVVVGAGSMAQSAAQALLAAGAHVSLVNRSLEHARRLADALGPRVQPAGLDTLPRVMAEATILLAATGARRPLVDLAMARAAAEAPRSAPLVLVDLGLPRNIAPDVRMLPGVRLIDLDDLQRLCPIDVALRQAEVDRAEQLAHEHAEAIGRWLRVRAMSPTIAALRSQADAIRLLELRRAAPSLARLTPEQQAAVTQLTESIVNKLLHGPTVALREAAANSNGLDSSQRVFDTLRLDRGRHVEPRAPQSWSETRGSTRSNSTRVRESERPGG